MAADTIEELLLQLRTDLAARRAEPEAWVARLKAAADDYLRAVEEDLVAEMAARCGLGAAGAPTAARAALAVRALAEALPEGQAKAEVPSETQDAAVADAPKGPPAAPAPKADVAPEIVALYREFQAAGFDALSDALFKPTAEEFACRARALQSRGLADPDELLTRMFRILTAKSFHRNLRDVFGLARNHHGDWDARAERARNERMQVQASPQGKGISTRLVIPEVLRSQVLARNGDASSSGGS